MERSQAEVGALEASLMNLVQDHQQAALHLQEYTEKAKKDAIRKAVRVSNLLVDSVNGGVEESFIIEKQIESEIRALAATITRFMKQSDQWLSATHAMNTAIKEIGDFENWMKVMEFDCKSIGAAIHNIHKE
ncbi:Biogenesis of lysosome-related organelles complex 1 subunit 1 [Linum perenne]